VKAKETRQTSLLSLVLAIVNFFKEILIGFQAEKSDGILINTYVSEEKDAR
jgi:hypothetical protein